MFCVSGIQDNRKKTQFNLAECILKKIWCTYTAGQESFDGERMFRHSSPPHIFPRISILRLTFPSDVWE